MIDPKKLVAMMKQGRPNEDGYDPGAGQEHHARQGDEEEVEEGSEEDRKRSPEVSYMELSELAGAFSCGNCTWAGGGEFCENPKVQAEVSADNGCCNLFYPEAGGVVFPPGMQDPREQQGAQEEDDGNDELSVM